MKKRRNNWSYFDFNAPPFGRGSLLFAWVSALMFVFILSSCGSKNLKRANDYIDAGMFEQATQLLQLEIQDNPKNAQAHYLLGIALLSMKSVSEAQLEFDKAILIDGKYTRKVGEGYVRAGMGLIDKEDRFSATQFFQEAVKHDPNIKSQLAKSLFDKGLKIGKQNPESPRVLELFMLAKTYDSKFNESIAQFCFTVANSQLEKDSLAQAADYAYASGVFDPKFIKEGGKFLYKIGMEFFKQGKVDNGRATFQRAVQRYPEYTEDSPDFVYYMADYYYSQGDFVKSKELFKRVAENFPTSNVADSAKSKLENWTVSRTVSIMVPADRVWTPTNIVLAPGTGLAISATGTINHGGPRCGPQGNLSLIDRLGETPLRGERFGLLIGKIGLNGRPFPIGTTFSIDKIENTGELYLGINDSEYRDNSGYFNVQVKYWTKE